MVQARDQKECLKIHYARETFQETQQVWAAATFQSVCCVYLVHSGGFFLENICRLSEFYFYSKSHEGETSMP